MDYARWQQLMEDDSQRLGLVECAQGWHFCYDWDGLLVGPAMMEWESCHCPHVILGYLTDHDRERRGSGASAIHGDEKQVLSDDAPESRQNQGGQDI